MRKFGAVGLMVGSAIVMSLSGALAVSGSTADVESTERSAPGLVETADDISSASLGGSRIAGSNRYETAVAVARQRAGGNLSDLVGLIVVNGESFPDGLAASGLAGLLDICPSGVGGCGRTAILLTQAQSLPATTERAIRDSNVPADAVYVIGGTAVVSANVIDQIARAAGWDGAGSNPVVRIAGANRYETAAAVAEFVVTEAVGALPPSYRTVLVANGESFPDALAAGALAYRNGHLLLLSPPGSAPASTRGALTRLSADCAVLLGGTAALSPTVASQTGAALAGGGCGVQRIGGANRYETATLIADRFMASNGDPSAVLLVSGTSFPDALSAAPLAGFNAPMVLTGPLELSAATRAWLDANRARIGRLDVIGGQGAVADAVATEARTGVRPDAPPAPDPGLTPPPGATEPPTRGDHAFLYQMGGGVYARWDPCRPLRYAVNPGFAQGNQRRMMDEAIALAVAATGIDFQYVGETTAGHDYFIGEPLPVGVDAVLVFADPSRTPSFTRPGLAGIGGGQSISNGRAAWVANGAAQVNSATTGDGDLHRLVWLHELGHMLGLDHVLNDREVMYPSAVRNLPNYQNGDREGLWRLGADQGCIIGRFLGRDGGPGGEPTLIYRIDDLSEVVAHADE